MAQTFESLHPVFDYTQIYCLNEADKHRAKEFLQNPGTDKFLESDCDEQLLLTIPFNSPVRLHSLVIEGPEDKAPSHIKLFQNKPSFDFSNAESLEAVQELTLTKDDVKQGAGKQIPLRFVKFQNCNSLIIFVDKNHGNSDTTVISKLVILGSEIKVEGTKMDPEAAPTNSRVSATDLLNQ